MQIKAIVLKTEEGKLATVYFDPYSENLEINIDGYDYQATLTAAVQAYMEITYGVKTEAIQPIGYGA